MDLTYILQDHSYLDYEHEVKVDSSLLKANLVVIVVIVAIADDKLRWCQYRQSWHNNNSRFSVEQKNSNETVRLAIIIRFAA